MSISAGVETILERIREITGGKYLNTIKIVNGSAMVTCPFHGDHSEKHPSCGVIIDKNSDKEGVYHCFACGEKGPLWKLVGACLEKSEEEAKEWLIDNFADAFIEDSLYIPEIVLGNNKKEFLSEKTLNNFEYDNERAIWYLTEKRHLKKEVVDYFKIGYELATDSITFPIYDENNNLVGISKRSVSGKKFVLPAFTNKPCYLLNEAINKNYTHVYLVESQINALTLYGYGIPAVALFGTGSSYQYDLLNKSGIRHYTLCFDGDSAGKKGRDRFIQNIRKDVLIDYIDMPEKTDVNDLSEEEFFKLQINT